MCLDVTSGSTLRVLPSAVGGTLRSMIHASSFHTSDGNVLFTIGHLLMFSFLEPIVVEIACLNA